MDPIGSSNKALSAFTANCSECYAGLLGGLSFSFRCCQCDDFNLCGDCAAAGKHPEHHLMRLSGSPPAWWSEIQRLVNDGVGNQIKKGKSEPLLSDLENSWEPLIFKLEDDEQGIEQPEGGSSEGDGDGFDDDSYLHREDGLGLEWVDPSNFHFIPKTFRMDDAAADEFNMMWTTDNVD